MPTRAIPTDQADGGVTPARISQTHRLIQPHIRQTPLLSVAGADFGLDGVMLALKLELLQHSGSFKARGAFANLLLRQVPPAGVVAASGGNHGAAVAYASMKLGLPAKIFVPLISSPAKIQRIRDYGADLVVGGERPRHDARFRRAGGKIERQQVAVARNGQHTDLLRLKGDALRARL